MKSVIFSGALLLGTLMMSGCTPGNNVPGSTAVGSITGGLIASQIFHGRGRFAGVVAGALIGGIIGNKVGNYMDEQDRINMENAIIHTPVNRQATWTSNRPGPNGQRVTYKVRPIRVTHRHNRYCREYRTTVIIGGRRETAFGRACQMPDGQWKIMH